MVYLLSDILYKCFFVLGKNSVVLTQNVKNDSETWQKSESEDDIVIVETIKPVGKLSSLIYNVFFFVYLGILGVI